MGNFCVDCNNCMACVSGNTQAGRKRYTRCVRRAMRQAQRDPAYARYILDRLGLYDENGLFRGNRSVYFE